MRVEAVVFDLFGTLVPPFSMARFEGTLAAMAAALGVDAGEFSRRWKFETEDRQRGRFETMEANIRHICDSLGAGPTAAQVAEAARIRIAFTRQALQPRRDAVPTLQKIRDAGLRLGLISDCSAEVPLLWPETEFASLIDVPVFSCVAGVKKPDLRIYELACEGLGVAAERCLYVGDGFSRELTGALRAGMKAVLIAPPDEPVEEAAQAERRDWLGPVVGSLSEVASMVV